MREVVGGVVLDEVEVDPLGEYALSYLTAKKRECPYLDFKLIIDIGKDSDFPEVAKDIFAFGNHGGGWILIGWKEIKSSQYKPVGLPDEYIVDQATLQEKFNSFSNLQIELGYFEFIKIIEGKSLRFAAIYVPQSYEIMKPIKDGKYIRNGKEKIVFRKDDIFYRRGSQSIHPNEYEMQLIKNRLENENYRLSVLSGEPDKITETIFSNLFPITKLPKLVYTGIKKDYDDISMKVLLKQEGVFPEFYFKFKEWNKRIVTFENLFDEGNSYRKLVDLETITEEPIVAWLENPDKNRIIVEILSRELIHYAMNKGMFYFRRKNKLYYPLKEEDRRQERWRGRYRESTRTVASRIWAEQLGRFIYYHVAFNPRFIQLDTYDFYLRILPTIVITDNGKTAIKGPEEGSVITRLSYNKYNSIYLNTILFWIHQLGNGTNIKLGDNIEISSEPSDILPGINSSSEGANSK